MDINSFIPSTLEIVRRDELSNEGAAGTVDATHFENWIETHLLQSWVDMSMVSHKVLLLWIMLQHIWDRGLLI